MSEHELNHPTQAGSGSPDAQPAAREILVLQAGLGSPSSTRLLADELSREVAAALPRMRVRVVDLREHAHAIMDAMLQGFAAPALQEELDAVLAAVGLVVVTPTFQASYSGLFKSFIDLIEPGSLRDKPLIMAATGGTERHSLVLEHALRPLMIYLGADPVRTGIFAATGDFGTSALTGRARRAAAELAARVRARTGEVAATDPASGPIPDPAAGPQRRAASGPLPSRQPAGFGDDLVDFETMMNQMGVGR